MNVLVAHFEGTRVDALQAVRGNGHVCPKCKDPVVLKRGRIVTPHFAHKPPVSCDWASGETLAHLEAKRLFAKLFTDRGLHVEVEHVIPSLPSYRRADVMVWPKAEQPVAIELQHTSIGLDEIEERAFAYARVGVSQMWIPFLHASVWDLATELDNGHLIERYPAKPFERWIHGLNHGHIPFFDPRTKSLWIGTFEPHLLVHDGGTWFEPGGVENYSSGYTKRSRRWRELTLKGPFALTEIFFKVQMRERYDKGIYRWPQGGIVHVLTKSKDAK